MCLVVLAADFLEGEAVVDPDLAVEV